MEFLEILNSKKIKLITKKLNQQFEFNSNILKEYAVFMKKNDSSIKICSKDISKINLENLKIDSIGLKIGKEISDGILLSIEGTQLLGKYCNKNIIQLSYEQLKYWLTGQDFKIEDKENKFIILKYNEDFVGSAKLKDGIVINNVTKPRRLTISAL
jgi:NOL1/NOP2/fmu family ribosome biogenesis protein